MSLFSDVWQVLSGRGSEVLLVLMVLCNVWAISCMLLTRVRQRAQEREFLDSRVSYRVRSNSSARRSRVRR